MKSIYGRLPTKKTPIALDILRRLAKPSEEFPEGVERLMALDFLEDSEIEILDRFSQIIEAEWQKVQGAAA